jgi:hypothetical protein
MPEPRDPLLKVLYNYVVTQTILIYRMWISSDRYTPAEASGGLTPYDLPKQQGHVNMGWRVAHNELNSL